MMVNVIILIPKMDYHKMAQYTTTIENRWCLGVLKYFLGGREVIRTSQVHTWMHL